jgi:hypothetical protein
MFVRGGETVIIKKPTDSGEVDDYNEPVLTFTNTTVKGCLIAFGSTNQPVEVNRNPEDIDITVYMPKGTVVNNEDILIIRNTEFVKDGVPQEWESPFSGYRVGLVVKVRRRNG